MAARIAATPLLGLLVRIPPGTWMSFMSVVCYHVKVSALGWSLVQRSPTECGVYECIMKPLHWRGALAHQGLLCHGGGGLGGRYCRVQIVRLAQFTPLSVRIFIFTPGHPVRSTFAHRTSDCIIISSSVFVILSDTIEGNHTFCRRYSLWLCGPEWD